MNKKYKRLTYQDRELLGRSLVQGLNQSQIAQLLGVHKSTVSREINRNKELRLGYIVNLAQYLTEKRRAHYKSKIESNPYLLNHIREKLKLGWSPSQISGRAKLSGNKSLISHESIYAYLFSPQGKEQKLYTYLRSRQKRRFPKIARKKNKRSLIPNRISIHERPEKINNRDEFGHWEADLIVFSKDKRASILTMRERKSRFLIALKNNNRSPATINQNLLQSSNIRSIARINSITFDNDISFRNHGELAQSFSAKTYFCDPFKSYQKGGIENANRSLREYCPRKMDIQSLQQKELDHYIMLINQRPMKCLGYRTPEEVYFKLAATLFSVK